MSINMSKNLQKHQLVISDSWTFLSFACNYGDFPQTFTFKMAQEGRSEDGRSALWGRA